MKKYIDYKIIESDNKYWFETESLKLLQLGYIPFGSNLIRTQYYYIRDFVKIEDDENFIDFFGDKTIPDQL